MQAVTNTENEISSFPATTPTLPLKCSGRNRMT
jgi:hypothetical protein